jgi:hypothetical protein
MEADIEREPNGEHREDREVQQAWRKEQIRRPVFSHLAKRLAEWT